MIETPKRKPNELFENYRKRLKDEKDYVKSYLSGRFIKIFRGKNREQRRNDK